MKRSLLFMCALFLCLAQVVSGSCGEIEYSLLLNGRELSSFQPILVVGGESLLFKATTTDGTVLKLGTYVDDDEIVEKSDDSCWVRVPLQGEKETVFLGIAAAGRDSQNEIVQQPWEQYELHYSDPIQRSEETGKLIPTTDTRNVGDLCQLRITDMQLCNVKKNSLEIVRLLGNRCYFLDGYTTGKNELLDHDDVSLLIEIANPTDKTVHADIRVEIDGSEFTLSDQDFPAKAGKRFVMEPEDFYRLVGTGSESGDLVTVNAYTNADLADHREFSCFSGAPAIGLVDYGVYRARITDGQKTSLIFNEKYADRWKIPTQDQETIDTFAVSMTSGDPDNPVAADLALRIDGVTVYVGQCTIPSDRCQWIILGQDSAQQIAEYLKNHVDSTDFELYVDGVRYNGVLE